jgi:RNA polymerase sporulation-specific sigma factor
MKSQKKIIDLKLKSLSPAVIKKLLKDEQLFNRFFRMNKGFIDEIVLRVTKRDKFRFDYDDLFQAACIGLIKALKKFNGQKKVSFSTFAFTVMINEIFLEIKRYNKQKHIYKLEEGGSFHGETSLSDTKNNSNQDSVEFNEMLFSEDDSKIASLRNFESEIVDMLLIKERMQKFSGMEKQMFRMRYIERRTIKDIAKELKLKRSTVRHVFYHKLRPKMEHIQRELNQS